MKWDGPPLGFDNSMIGKAVQLKNLGDMHVVIANDRKIEYLKPQNNVSQLFLITISSRS